MNEKFEEKIKELNKKIIKETKKEKQVPSILRCCK